MGNSNRDQSPVATQYSWFGTLGRGLLFVQLALSPVLFSRETIEIFEYNKVALLMLTAIALGALGLSALTLQLAARLPLTALLGPVRRVFRDPIALGILLFTASATVSTIYSLSPRTSWRGCHESYAGLMTILAYTVLFFGTRALCRTPADGRRLLAAAVVGAAVTATYAVAQTLHADLIPWDPASVSYVGSYVRPFASMGHPNFLGAYLVMAFPILVYFTRQAAERRQWLPLLVFTTAGVCSCLGIVASLSRGAWIAFAGMLLVLVAGWLRIGDRRLNRRRVAFTFLAGLGLVGLAVAVLGGERVVSGVVGRLQRLGDSPARVVLWRAAWQIFTDAPLVGCGPDGFQLAFPPKRTVEYWNLEWSITPTRAHNEALHILATQGLGGALAALVFTVGLLVSLIRAWRRSSASVKPLLTVLAAGLVGFYIQDAFSFTVAGCGTLFVTLAALLSRLANQDAEPETAATAHRPREFSVCLVSAGILVLAALGCNIDTNPLDAGCRMLMGGGAVCLSLGLVLWGMFRWDASEPITPRSRSPQGAARTPRPIKPSGAWVCPVLIGGLALALMVVGVLQPMRANRACHDGDRWIEADPERSLQSYRRATALDPGAELYWAKLGTAAYTHARRVSFSDERQHLYAQALDAFEQSIRLVPLNANNHINLGRTLAEMAYQRLAEPGPVFEEFDQGLAGDPNNALFYVEAAHAAVLLWDGQRAQRYTSQGLQRYPRYGPLRAQIGYMAFNEKRYADAAAGICEVVNPANGYDWNGDAYSLCVAVSLLAAAHYNMQSYDAAIAFAQDALQKMPDWIPPRFILAEALEKSGRCAEALREYRLVYARCPGDRPTIEALRRLERESGNPSAPALPNDMGTKLPGSEPTSQIKTGS